MMNNDYTWTNDKFLNATVLANLMNFPIHFTSPDCKLIFVNDAWCSVYNVKREDALGKCPEDAVEVNNYYLSVKSNNIFNPSDSTFEHLETPLNQSMCHYVVRRKEPVMMLTQISNDNKIMVYAAPIFNEFGDIICIVTSLQDLTMFANWRDYIEEETYKNKLLRKELRILRNNQTNSQLIGSSNHTIELRKLISIVASSEANVLISGESGTGKEVVAREIFSQSKRNNKPFITVNCAAIPENLLESELFGHEKGAFTSAISSKTGLFELANGGTIMLDEIGEFPMHLQPKLLRVLQEHEFRHVGGTKKIPFNARVIAATNRDLLAMTKAGEFRMDLYYRLNVFPIRIWPLRDRKEDIALLASSFLSKFNTKYEKKKFFTSQALFALEQYSWPGNVRELENIIERITVIGEESAITADLVQKLISHEDPYEEVTATTLKEAVNNLERKLISEALEKYKTTYKAAEALGTTQPTLVRKAKLLGISKH